MAYKPYFLACSAILDSFVHAYSPIMHNFVIVSLFLEKHSIPQYYRSLISCVFAYQCFGQGGCYCGCNEIMYLQLYQRTTLFHTLQFRIS